MLSELYNSPCWPETRPAITKADMECISAMFGVFPIAEQIFITGEITIDSIGDMACMFYIHCNDVFLPPLFSPTDKQTVRMLRYRWSDVLPLLPKERMAKLCMAEVKRLGLEYYSLQWGCFYFGAFTVNKLFGKYIVLDDEMSTMYVNAVLLLKKPGYMCMSLPEFFHGFLLKASDCMTSRRNRKPN